MKTPTKKVKIFGVKNDEDKFIYIGKTEKKPDKDTLVKSDFHYQYLNDNLRKNILKNKNTKIDIIKSVAKNEWYDEKLLEVVNHYKKKHPSNINLSIFKNTKDSKKLNRHAILHGMNTTFGNKSNTLKTLSWLYTISKLI